MASGAGKGALPALPQLQTYGKAGHASITHGSGPYTKGGSMKFGKGSNRFSGGQFKPSKLCQFWMKDPSLCAKGDACTFAHGEEELQSPISQYAATETFAPVASMITQTPRRFAGGFAPTILCRFWMQDPSLCSKGDSCSFAHGESELQSAVSSQAVSVEMPNRFRPGFAPVKLCQFWINDPASCMKGNACTFAHGVEELQSHASEDSGSTGMKNRFSDTGFKPAKLCQFWSQDPSLCTKGDACSFAHGEEELRSWIAPDALLQQFLA